MKKFLLFCIINTTLSVSVATEYLYDGVYHCHHHIYGAGGSEISDAEKAQYFLPEDNKSSIITIKDHVMTFTGFSTDITGETAHPRVRASKRTFSSYGGSTTINFAKGDLLYSSKDLVQVFFPQIYEFQISFLLDSYRITYAFSDCDKEGGNQYYIDDSPAIHPEEPSRQKSAGSAEYEAAQKIERQDKRQYISLLQKSANSGYVDAMLDLGFYYEYQQNYQKAHEWYRKARGNGSHEATFRLARAYHFGKGVPRNWDTAAKLYLKSGALGKVSLGNYFIEERDYYAAYEMFRQGCELNDLSSCGRLEELEESGFVRRLH
ncbi:sel1 repeat family protein [Ignatzschineria rhizosphaerae]|uniref:Sel1 repeat family protein n=1 Tax=Ignatzschineria rhizosphaerae TaxID=2923279 RepID=A0ABY3X2D6_9GAMM|nr:tetratricopeptide repeat protein [Ignatzschineria rhizosphaerae]UNM97043.1 sel1 repeat family protein [Ignatzschineria rhizosphaerae]